MSNEPPINEACHWCGCLPAGTAGHTGEHRTECPAASGFQPTGLVFADYTPDATPALLDEQQDVDGPVPDDYLVGAQLVEALRYWLDSPDDYGRLFWLAVTAAFNDDLCTARAAVDMAGLTIVREIDANPQWKAAFDRLIDGLWPDGPVPA